MESALMNSARVYEAARSTPTTASRLAARAVQALLDEANLTPKPALVDQRGGGAHSDLTLALMHRSACALLSCFEAIAIACDRMPPSRQLREHLGEIGRRGERQMFATTGGINTHKGALWSLGLLVAGAVISADADDPFAIAATAGAIARYSDSRAGGIFTHGARVQRLYGMRGARGEAEQGFPHVVDIGFPALLDARSRGVPENCARLNALMAIMAELDDTCLLHRGGLHALHTARQGARWVLNAGGTSTSRGFAQLLELDRELLRMNASPGGSADLLAATLFLDSLTRSSDAQRSAHDFDGDLALWKN
ncbi:MAG TPA: triphosphoribosyl-dephospho-CoA synthase [Terracidiphilus sp.]|nr:triphosphoribosyl-dephospho-CoA synthase [Terracidiphilus sp.]